MAVKIPPRLFMVFEKDSLLATFTTKEKADALVREREGAFGPHLVVEYARRYTRKTRGYSGGGSRE